MIERNRDGRNLKRLCDLHGVSRSGYYAWKGRDESAHRQQDRVLMAAIKELHQGFRRCYGARRVHRVLRASGYVCSIRRVNRLMRELGIKASTTGLYQWRPGLHEFYSSTGNALKGASQPTAAGQQWAGDFTYVRTAAGWLYHAVVIDLYSRRVIGWSFKRERSTELTLSALRMALAWGARAPGCVFHSDQGIEYAAHAYRDLVLSSGLQRSMSRKGTPLDNATVESYFHTLKSELVHQMRFADHYEAVAHISAYIEFYNRERLHSSIDYQSPAAYEGMCA